MVKPMDARAVRVPFDVVIEQMIVACAQEHVSVQLTIEEWDDTPAPFSDGFLELGVVAAMFPRSFDGIVISLSATRWSWAK